MKDLLAKKLVLGGLTLDDLCGLIAHRIDSIEVHMLPSAPGGRRRVASFRYWELTEALDLYHEDIRDSHFNDPEPEMRFPLEIEVKVQGNKATFTHDGEEVQILFLESKQIDLVDSIMEEQE